MKKLIFSILFIVCGVVALDRAVGFCFSHFVYSRSKDVVSQKVRYIAEEMNEDILLFGTSRCGSHYVPDIITDTLGMTCYNAGIDGSQNIYSHYCALNLLLTHHTPRIVCLEVMQCDLYKYDDDFATLGFFAPFIGQSNATDSIIGLTGKYRIYKMFSSYRYNANAVNLLGSMLARGHELKKGFLPKGKSPKDFDPISNCEQREIDQDKLDLIEAFADRCAEKNIQLIFTISPWYTTPYPGMYEPLQHIAQKHGNIILNNHSLFADRPDLFYNVTHLSGEGAEVYTSIFASELKSKLR